MHGERGEEPLADAVVAEHLLVADEVLVGLLVAVDDDAEHVLNGVAMAVERRALQRVAVGHAVDDPLLVQFFEGQSAIGPERVDDPDVLVKNLSRFHAYKSSRKKGKPPNLFPTFLTTMSGILSTCPVKRLSTTSGNKQKKTVNHIRKRQPGAAARRRGGAAFGFCIVWNGEA